MFKQFVTMYLKYNQPLASFMQIMNNMPTNYSTYLYERLYDIKQRVDNGLAVMTLNISASA